METYTRVTTDLGPDDSLGWSVCDHPITGHAPTLSLYGNSIAGAALTLEIEHAEALERALAELRQKHAAWAAKNRTKEQDDGASSNEA
jgi:hypothetical protein